MTSTKDKHQKERKIMHRIFAGDGDVTVFVVPNDLGEIGISVQPGLRDGYAAFSPTRAREIAATLLEVADAVDGRTEC
jgi:hypothetical protein